MSDDQDLYNKVYRLQSFVMDLANRIKLLEEAGKVPKDDTIDYSDLYERRG